MNIHSAWRVLRAEQLPVMPWKNGGGTTQEIARYPQDADLDHFVWRLSMAQVGEDGAFSAFPGVDRQLLLLAGRGMRLDRDAADAIVLDRLLTPLAFAGETAIHARLLDGPCRDFNLMLRRGQARGRIDVLSAGAHALKARQLALFCPDGEIDVSLAAGCAVTLMRHDTLLLDASDGIECRFEGGQPLLAVSIDY